MGEAEEIYRENPWLNYGMALHSAREFGLASKVFDLLDERPLLIPEIKEFFEAMFGWTEIPEPSLDWAAFQSYVETRLREEGETWNPMKRRMGPWVDVRVLLRCMGANRGSCSIS